MEETENDKVQKERMMEHGKREGKKQWVKMIKEEEAEMGGEKKGMTELIKESMEQTENERGVEREDDGVRKGERKNKNKKNDG